MRSPIPSLGGRVRLSALEGREMVNLRDGSMLGPLAEADMLINERCGRILQLVVPERAGLWSRLFHRREIVIPWRSVVRIGPEAVIIDRDLDRGAGGA